MFYRLTFAIIFSIVSVLPTLISAQSPIRFDGFYRFESGLLTQSPTFLFNRNVVQSALSFRDESVDARVSARIRHSIVDISTHEFDLHLREVYGTYSFRNMDIRLGRQMIVWGRADATQIHDIITPMDLSEFLTQDFTDLRLGITALNLQVFRGDDSIQFLWIPFRESTRFPQSGDRWGPTANNSLIYQNNSFHSYNFTDYQTALRFVLRPNLNLDLDLTAYYGYTALPAYKKTIVPSVNGTALNLEPTYFKSPALMFGSEYRISNHLAITTEFAFWWQRYFDYSPQRAPGSDPIMPIIPVNLPPNLLVNSDLLQSMAGLRYSRNRTTYSLQYVSDWILDHSDILQDEYSHFVSLLITGTDPSDQINFRLLSRYNLNGSDYWLNPELIYTPRDAWRISAGTHIFKGPDNQIPNGTIQFGEYSDNSFVYMKLTRYW